MLKTQKFLVVLASMLMVQSTFAATATGTLAVTATVGAACTVGVGSNLLPFGTYTPGVTLDVNGLLSVQCTSTVPYTIALDQGAGAGATINTRILTNPSPAGTLQYTVYTDPSRTTVWGNGTTGSTVSGVGTGSSDPKTVPGRIFAAQSGTITPGNYTDTVNITVNF